jgi:hypothetical protein
MKLRQALKVRNRFHAGLHYRHTTILAMRRRLVATPYGTDASLWFEDLLSQFHREAPIEFAALQFNCGMSLAKTKAEIRKQHPERFVGK